MALIIQIGCALLLVAGSVLVLRAVMLADRAPARETQPEREPGPDTASHRRAA